MADSVADLDPSENPAVTGPPSLRGGGQARCDDCGLVDTDGRVTTPPARIATEAVAALRADTQSAGTTTDEARPLIATTAYLGELELLHSSIGTTGAQTGVDQPTN